MEIRKGMRAEGDPRERKKASGEELSAPPSRVTAAEPCRRRHWGHRASSSSLGPPSRHCHYWVVIAVSSIERRVRARGR
ncbi:hypothetical protein AHAS_Ahas20G0218200 [Arachis hypogaea]